MANKHRIDKEEAIRLRTAGYSYKEIASVLGCSEAWCAKELGGVERGERQHHTDPIAVKAKAIVILEDALEKLRSI